MSEFDVRFAAYERAMHTHNNFGLSGDALSQQYGRYALALQLEEIKAKNKASGRAHGKALAQERAAATRSLPSLNELPPARTYTGRPLFPQPTQTPILQFSQLTPEAAKRNIMFEAQTEHVSLNRNVRDIQKQQRNLYKESVRGQVPEPMANRFSVQQGNVTKYYIQYPDGTVKEFSSHKEQIKEIRRMMKKEGIKFDPNAKVPEGFDPVNPNGTPKPDPVKPNLVKPEPVQPDPVKPDPVKPDPVKPEPVQPEPVQPDPVKPDPVRPDPLQPEGQTRVKPSRAERLKKIRNNPEARARYKKLKLALNPELKARFDKMAKFKKMKGIGKAGKAGLIALGAVALIGGAMALFGGKDKKAEEVKPDEALTPKTEPEVKTDSEPDNTKVDDASTSPIVDNDAANPTQPIVPPVTDETDETKVDNEEKIEEEGKTDEAKDDKEEKADDGQYTSFKAIPGSWEWRFAQRELLLEHIGEADYKPSDAEIAKRAEEIAARSGRTIDETGHTAPTVKVDDEILLKEKMGELANEAKQQLIDEHKDQKGYEPTWKEIRQIVDEKIKELQEAAETQQEAA